MPSSLPDFSAFKATLKEWANRDDWDDDLVTSFVRGAEEKVNSELRIDRMIQTNDALITGSCAPLPDDWLEMDLVRQSDTVRWWPIRYMPRDDFFASETCDTNGFYTLEGREIFIGGPADAVNGNTIRISYYGEVPIFADDNDSWLYTKYPTLYRCAALMNADLHAVGEEDRAAQLKQLAEDIIQKLNAQHRYARASGSKLVRARMRSFG